MGCAGNIRRLVRRRVCVHTWRTLGSAETQQPTTVSARLQASGERQLLQAVLEMLSVRRLTETRICFHLVDAAEELLVAFRALVGEEGGNSHPHERERCRGREDHIDHRRTENFTRSETLRQLSQKQTSP